jgi:hypothetical protein
MEAKKTVRALIMARGGNPTSELIAQECRNALALAWALDEIFRADPSRALTGADLQNLFVLPPARRDAIKAALA